ncbi:OSBL1-like protein [Mya arenaria]|uniref:OSBL1-like protein n=1 Tax=Mya arenaria TaxID=6604 RepID=A0ABY7F4Z3_MYAAR|nr:OSBL1-like protein [Mya arenaria]
MCPNDRICENKPNQTWVSGWYPNRFATIRQSVPSILKQRTTSFKDPFSQNSSSGENHKRKMKALYGSWIYDLFGVDNDAFEDYMKNKPSSPKHTSSENGDSSEVEDNIPTHHLSAFNLNIPGQVALWSYTPRPSNTDQYFSFTYFSMALNELVDGMQDTLPPTDSRLRPDRWPVKKNTGLRKNRDGFSLGKTRSLRKKTGFTTENTGTENGLNVQTSFDNNVPNSPTVFIQPMTTNSTNHHFPMFYLLQLKQNCSLMIVLTLIFLSKDSSNQILESKMIVCQAGVIGLSFVPNLVNFTQITK